MELMIDRECPYEAILEPFLGAGHYSINHCNYPLVMPEKFFWGEKDPSVRAVHRIWLSDNETRKECEKAVKGYQDIFRAVTDTESVWGLLANDFNKAAQSYNSGLVDSVISMAAASLAVRKLTFAGMVRTNKETNLLNVRYVKGEVSKFKQWNYTFGEKLPRSFQLSDSWQQCFQDFAASSFETAAILIDPPYYKGASPCYPGHEPKRGSTKDLTIFPLKRALWDVRIRRIVVTNYDSEEMNLEILASAEEFGFEVQKLVSGALTQMQRSKSTTTKNTQGFWIIDKDKSISGGVR